MPDDATTHTVSSRGAPIDVEDRLRAAEETLAAIRAGAVDALVVAGRSGEQVVLTDRGSDRPYRAMVEGMSEGAATVDTDGTILYGNRRLSEMLGVAHDTLVGTCLLDHTVVDRRAELAEALGRRRTESWRAEVELCTADGGSVPVQLSFRSLTLEGVTVQAVLLTDLREQKRSEAMIARGQLAQRILDQASEAIVVNDDAGTVRHVNRVAVDLLAGADPLGRPFHEAFPLELEGGDDAAGLLAEGRARRARARVRGARGAPRRLLVSSSRLRAADGHELGAVVTLTDVTHLEHATERLERHARHQHATAELGRAALSRTPLPELARACEDALRALLDVEDVRISLRFGGRAPGPSHLAASPRHPHVLRRDIRTKEGVLGTLEIDPGRGVTPPADDLGFVENLTSILSLAAEQQVLHARLEHQAHHDALTGLPNRLLLEDRLQQAMARARRDGTSVAVLFIDLDRFKHINDTLGHQAGNDVLVQVGERLRDRVRPTDTIARLGGDEFVLVHADLKGPEEAIDVARSVGAALARPFDVDGRMVMVRATVGISVFPRDGDETSTLIAKSDNAMYHGKRGGRNTVRFFTEGMNVITAARLEMEHDFQVALERGQLEMHFQPQVCARTGEVLGLEALTRWKHPRLGWIAPSRFVPVAEDTGLVIDLGFWALHEACRHAAHWIGPHGRPKRISVNVSPTHFSRPDFIDTVRSALRSGGLEPDALELEVTESIMMHDVDTVKRRLAALRDLGVGIALDDFGLGYFSVNYLRTLPLDRLKIDRSFVDTRSASSGPAGDQVAVLSAITTMAQALGLQVTIEGVENDVELAMARTVGCDEVQGFLFGRPAPATATGHLLANWQQHDALGGQDGLHLR